MGLIGSWKNNGEKIRKHEKNSSSRKFTETDGQNGFAIPSPIRKSKNVFLTIQEKHLFFHGFFLCSPQFKSISKTSLPEKAKITR